MNIMFIIPRMGGGGAERVTAHIANYLSENDYDVTLTTFISGEWDFRLFLLIFKAELPVN